MARAKRIRQIRNRVLQLIPVLLLVTFFAFLMLRLAPGDPAYRLAGEDATLEQVEVIRHIYGLDQPIPVQYGTWLWNALHGDLSVSMMSREPVLNLIKNRYPVTLYLVAYGMVIAIVIGVPLGIAAAAYPGSRLESAVAAISSLGVALPSFWLGMILVLMLSLKLRLFPATGLIPFSEDPLRSLQSATLPAIAIAVGGIAAIARQMHAAVSEFLTSPHVRMLKAKGLSFSAILWKHGLKNVGVTVLTVIGVIFTHQLGATTVIETIFAIPGTSGAAVQAAVDKDYAVVQGIILVLALTVVLVNLVTDMLYALLDPRTE